MGLLDNVLGSSMDDPRTMATLQLAQGLLSSPRALQGLSGGLLAYGDTMQQAKQRQAAEQMRAMQLQHMALQYQEQKRAMDQAEMDRKLQQQALTSISGAEANRASGIAGPRPEALGVVGQMPKYDPRQFVASGGSLQGAAGLAQLLAKEQAKIKEFREVRLPDGSVQIVGLDEYGKPVQTGQTPFKASERVDLGGKVGFVDPLNDRLRGTLGKSMTPDAVASNGLGWARLNFDKTQGQNAVTYQQDADGNFVALPTHANGAVKASPVIAPGAGMSPLQGKGAGMTEDQGKATGWLVQAENAFKNMQSAMKATPGAERPGFNDALTSTGNPALGALANSMRGADRQKFLQASSSFGEAVLRAATGAGVNKDEAMQKARELTPQIGDKQDVIDQKMAAFPLYIESLKVRAGPGAKRAAGISLTSGLPPDIADIMNKYSK